MSGGMPAPSYVLCQAVEPAMVGPYHRIATYEYGRLDNPNIMICVHGLTRNASDFHDLAKHFESRYRVVNVEAVGRGASDYLSNPDLYTYTQYISDMTTVLSSVIGALPPHARNQAQVTWVGLSMGGLIGMILASKTTAKGQVPIRTLVLDDVGPFVSKEALARLSTYVGKGDTFDDEKEALEYFQKVYPEMTDAMTAEQWDFFMRNSVRPNQSGTGKKLELSYDKEIGKKFSEGAASGKDFDLWSAWDNITCPVLLLRGAVSKVCTAETAERMVKSRQVETVPASPVVSTEPAAAAEEKAAATAAKVAPAVCELHTYEGLGHPIPLVNNGGRLDILSDIDQFLKKYDKIAPVGTTTAAGALRDRCC